MSTITITSPVHFLERKPKICVPIVETSEKGILRAGKELSKGPADVIEWRADYFEELTDEEQLKNVAEKLQSVLKGKPILFTIRTKSEGGQIDLSFAKYEEILRGLAGCSSIAYLDVEMFWGARGVTFENIQTQWNPEEAVYSETKRLVETIHEQGKLVIGSFHNFSYTPNSEEIANRLLLMKALGADIPKMAVMPQNQGDVLRLMLTTWETKESLRKIYGETPVITMAMDEYGFVTRAAAEVFGSAMTFGCMTGKESAPGQINMLALDGLLQMFHLQNQ